MRVLCEIERLAANPRSRGDVTITEETGRTNQLLLCEGCASTFWSDDPARELWVVDIRRQMH